MEKERKIDNIGYSREKVVPLPIKAVQRARLKAAIGDLELALKSIKRELANPDNGTMERVWMAEGDVLDAARHLRTFLLEAGHGKTQN